VVGFFAVRELTVDQTEPAWQIRERCSSNQERLLVGWTRI